MSTSDQPAVPAPAGTRTHTAILLALIVVLLAVCELASRLVFSSLKSNLRLRQEIGMALHIADTAGPNAPHRVLIVGNSLVLHGIDVPSVDSGLGPRYRADRLALVDEGYDGWRYGIRSLFDRGSRPDVVVLAISPAQFVSDRPPTGVMVGSIWTARAVVAYALHARADLTTATDLLLAHVSEFFALRQRLRQDTRKLIVPGYVAMSSQLFNRLPIVPDPTTNEPIAAARLDTLRRLCAEHGARFVYLIVPTRASDDDVLEAALVDAGHATGVPVVVPVPNASLPPAMLLDGYHLNDDGARFFSVRAGDALRLALGP
jgi:hypothetical protein